MFLIKSTFKTNNQKEYLRFKKDVHKTKVKDQLLLKNKSID
jgi:hypothetical protein